MSKIKLKIKTIYKHVFRNSPGMFGIPLPTDVFIILSSQPDNGESPLNRDSDALVSSAASNQVQMSSKE